MFKTIRDPERRRYLLFETVRPSRRKHYPLFRTMRDPDCRRFPLLETTGDGGETKLLNVEIEQPLVADEAL